MWPTVAESGHDNLALSIRKLGEFSVNIITTTQTTIAPESEWSTFHDRGDESVEELQQNWPNDIMYKRWREDEGSRKGEKAHGRDAAGWIQGFCVGAVSQCVCVCECVRERLIQCVTAAPKLWLLGLYSALSRRPFLPEQKWAVGKTSDRDQIRRKTGNKGRKDR